MDIIELRHRLQAAVELELFTLPPYLTAFFSIKSGTNQEAANLLRSVFMEEMLHMCLAANVLTAIGGSLQLKETNIPTYPDSLKFDGKMFQEREFTVGLGKFSPQSLCTFLKIELPEHWKENGFHVPLCPDLSDSPNSQMVTEVHGFTIAQFYDGIIEGLKELVSLLGEKSVFTGNPRHQVGINYYWGGGGEPITVTDLDSAQKALNVIIDQGEGRTNHISDGDKKYFGQPREVAHFFKFIEILYGQKYHIDQKPSEPPAGEKFVVNYDQVHPIKKDCKAADFDDNPMLASLNAEFNRHYTLMIKQIEMAFNGDPHILYSAIQDGMKRLPHIAEQMVSIPISKSSPETGAPTFEWVSHLPV